MARLKKILQPEAVAGHPAALDLIGLLQILARASFSSKTAGAGDSMRGAVTIVV